MTLLEALQDIGKGRIIDNGCNYELIALAKGRYTLTIDEEPLTITLTGTPGENADEIQRVYSDHIHSRHKLYNRITKAEYKKI